MDKMDKVPPYFEAEAKCEGHQVAAKAIATHKSVFEQIATANTNFCLDYNTRGGAKNRQHVILYPCQKGNKNQYWNFKRNADGSNQIRSVHGKCLDFNGTFTHMWDCDERNENQKWTRHKNTTFGDGIEVLENKKHHAWLRTDEERAHAEVSSNRKFMTHWRIG